jgi:hypothetical protein
MNVVKDLSGVPGVRLSSSIIAAGVALKSPFNPPFPKGKFLLNPLFEKEGQGRFSSAWASEKDASEPQIRES